MVKIRISGIRNADDIVCANEVQPAYIGFSFFDGLYRVTGNIASKLVYSLRPEIKTVGMFSDQDISEITPLLSAGIVDIVELCADESNEYIEALKLRTETKVIKRFSLKCIGDAVKINESPADYASLSLRDIARFPNISESIEKLFFVREDDITAQSVREIVRNFSPYAIDVPIRQEATMSVNRMIFGELCEEAEKY